MSQFILKINLGNDAMQEANDVRRAIHHAIKDVSFNLFRKGDASGIVKDINGNTVGSWKVK